MTSQLGHQVIDDPHRAAELYIELLKGCLTRELFPDAAIPRPFRRRDRLRAAGRRALAAGRPRPATGSEAYDPELRATGRDWPSEAETMIGRARLDNLHRCVVDVLRDGVEGDLIETGVWRGGATILMRGVLEAYGDQTRRVWVADSFQGVPKPDAEHFPADAGDFTWTIAELAVSADDVRANFARYGLLDARVRFLEGWFRDTLPSAPIESLAVLRLDGDLYESTTDALVHLYPRLSPGGYAVVDDYGAYDSCKQAVHDYRDAHGIDEPIQDIDGTGAFWRRRLTTG